VALGGEPADPAVMRRPPSPPAQSVLGGGLWQRIVRVGVVIAAVTLGVAFWAHSTGRPWQSMAFIALGATQLAVAIGSRARPGTWSNPMLPLAVAAALGLQLAGVYLPPLRDLLGTGPLALPDLACDSGTGECIDSGADWPRYSPTWLVLMDRSNASSACRCASRTSCRARRRSCRASGGRGIVTTGRPAWRAQYRATLTRSNRPWQTRRGAATTITSSSRSARLTSTSPGAPSTTVSVTGTSVGMAPSARSNTCRTNASASLARSRPAMATSAPGHAETRQVRTACRVVSRRRASATA
jgi:hypothetical protein